MKPDEHASKTRSGTILTSTLLLVLSLGLTAFAQSTASIEGQVTDPNGAVVAGAEIIVSSSAIAIYRKAATDDIGRYQIAFLPVGEYRIEIHAGFSNVDFSVVKNTKLNETTSLQFRAEAFDVFNHPSFGQPGRIVGTAGFGRITNTRFPTGDSGSSRQLQFALKLLF